MKPFVAPIVADSQRLLRGVVAVCADFPQRFKFILADRLVALALDSLLLGQRAARAGKKKPEIQLPLVVNLIDLNDRLQALLDVACEAKCFKSLGQYEAILDVAEKVGAQAEGWKNQISSALPSKQNPDASSRRECLGALSTDAASAEANT